MDMPSAQQAIASNKDAWDQSAGLHKDHGYLEALLTGVGNPDFSCLDPTLTGVAARRRVSPARTWCNWAATTAAKALSLFALGARSVVGVDQSAAFLRQARELADAVALMLLNSSKPISTICRSGYTSASISPW